MNHASLFSGIGGFDLAAEWMGWENVLHCEINPFCRRVLNHYWPKAKSYNDIKSTDFTIHRGAVDVLTGGFPCQPYSTAGKRLGKEDERHLWPEMLRAIREIQPRWVVGENVRGLTNWNGGLVFDEVQAELEAEGYEVLPFLLPACGVGAPHRRDRIWFVAHASHHVHSGGLDAGRNSESPGGSKSEDERQSGWTSYGKRVRAESGSSGENAAANSERSGGGQVHADIQREFANGKGAHALNEPGDWQNFPTVPPLCGGDDGLPRELDGITFSKWRNQSIQAYGNAVVPQIPYRIFKAIEQYELAV